MIGSGIFGPGAGVNWTWFELHLYPSLRQPTEKLSIWTYDDEVAGGRQWATTQSVVGANSVSPLKFYKSFGRVWTSPNTNNTYLQNWNLGLQDDTNLTIRSAFVDQELYNLRSHFATYEGFITVNGTSLSGDRLSGYGLVEIEPPSA